MSDEDRPEIVISNTTDVAEPTNLNRIPFEILDEIDKHIPVPNCPVTIDMYQVRTIEVEEPVSEIIFNVKKMGPNTRRIQLHIWFGENKFDCYTLYITVPTI